MFHRALLVVVALLPAAVAHAQSPVRYINPPGLSRPASTLIPVAPLARAELLVEIEAVAVLPSPPARR